MEVKQPPVGEAGLPACSLELEGLPGARAVLAEQVAQPRAESLELRTEPIDRDLGPIQLQGCLVAGSEQEDQRWDEVAVGGDVGSFLGPRASVESRSD
jgi:hypothetical protein